MHFNIIKNDLLTYTKNSQVLNSPFVKFSPDPPIFGTIMYDMCLGNTLPYVYLIIMLQLPDQVV